MIGRGGFDPIRPELSLPARRILQNSGVIPEPRVVVRLLPAEVSPMVVEVSGGMAPSAFACQGDSCVPSEIEVYVAQTEDAGAVAARVARSMGQQR